MAGRHCHPLMITPIEIQCATRSISEPTKTTNRRRARRPCAAHVSTHYQRAVRPTKDDVQYECSELAQSARRDDYTFTHNAHSMPITMCATCTRSGNSDVRHGRATRKMTHELNDNQLNDQLYAQLCIFRCTQKYGVCV